MKTEAELRAKADLVQRSIEIMLRFSQETTGLRIAVVQYSLLTWVLDGDPDVDALFNDLARKLVAFERSN